MSTRFNNLRREILFQLYACRPLAISAAFIARRIKNDGGDYTVLEVKTELAFLEDQKLVKFELLPATTEVLNKITANGIVHYEQTLAA